MIKSFRGLLADGEQETIRLSTNNGLTGYRINKFQAIGDNPSGQNSESLLKLYKYEQLDSAGDPDVTGTINFDDGTLLGVVYWQGGATAGDTPQDMVIIFDNEIFNQDIFITHHEGHGSQNCNYYLELEQVKLDLSEATAATLKDMRGSN